ncbi:hypothetical protein GDO78_002509 [Eleutherodactylus coqui]|uniref:Uncharacterized protein n=1 Tax=Eleutherodactylus coqui TaxID=57060 RepID=A0A8J6EXD3_ELECQ|nr:hypothetical protein GDO78_002509 [Eleutherodactylus coqui]
MNAHLSGLSQVHSGESCGIGQRIGGFGQLQSNVYEGILSLMAENGLPSMAFTWQRTRNNQIIFTAIAKPVCHQITPIHNGANLLIAMY